MLTNTCISRLICCILHWVQISSSQLDGRLWRLFGHLWGSTRGDWPQKLKRMQVHHEETNQDNPSPSADQLLFYASTNQFLFQVDGRLDVYDVFTWSLISAHSGRVYWIPILFSPLWLLVPKNWICMRLIARTSTPVLVRYFQYCHHFQDFLWLRLFSTFAYRCWTTRRKKSRCGWAKPPSSKNRLKHFVLKFDGLPNVFSAKKKSAEKKDSNQAVTIVQALTHPPVRILVFLPRNESHSAVKYGLVLRALSSFCSWETTMCGETEIQMKTVVGGNVMRGIHCSPKRRLKQWVKSHIAGYACVSLGSTKIGPQCTVWSCREDSLLGHKSANQIQIKFRFFNASKKACIFWKKKKKYNPPALLKKLLPSKIFFFSPEFQIKWADLHLIGCSGQRNKNGIPIKSLWIKRNSPVGSN